MSSLGETEIEIDSDDDEIVLAVENNPRQTRLNLSESSDEEDDDRDPTELLGRLQNNSENNKYEGFSSQISMHSSGLMPHNDQMMSNKLSTQFYDKHRSKKRDSTNSLKQNRTSTQQKEKLGEMLDDIIDGNEAQDIEKENQEPIHNTTERINLSSSDTNSSSQNDKNADDIPDLFENSKHPILINDDQDNEQQQDIEMNDNQDNKTNEDDDKIMDPNDLRQHLDGADDAYSIGTSTAEMFRHNTDEIDIMIENETDFKTQRQREKERKKMEKRQKELQTQQQNMEFTKHFDNITIQKNKQREIADAKKLKDKARMEEIKEKEASIQEKEKKQLEENQNFCNLFADAISTTNPRKRPRDAMENDDNLNIPFTQNMRKRHKSSHDSNHNRNISQPQLSPSPSPQPLPIYDPDDPFSIQFPTNYTFKRKKQRQNRNLSQRKPKKKAIGHKKQYSKSHRTAKQSNLSQQDEVTTSSLLDKLMTRSKPRRNQRRKVPFQAIQSSQSSQASKPRPRKKKQKVDPFAITMPTNFQYQSPINVSRMASSRNQSSQISQSTKSKSKTSNMSNNDKDKQHISLSMQLDQLINTSSHLSKETIVSNNNYPNAGLHSILPRSHHYKKQKQRQPVQNQQSNIEDIEPIRTTNEDLEYLHTPLRDKFMHRDNSETPKKIRSSMKTPTHTKKKRSDKEEMDESDDEIVDELNTSKIGQPPAWLTKLTDKAIETNKQRDFERKKKMLSETGYLTPDDQCIKPGRPTSSDKKDKNWIGPLQKEIMDLKLTFTHRSNMVRTYAQSIDKIPINLGVTDKMQLKILRVRRVSYYDLYSTICAYIDDDRINNKNKKIKIRSALVFFQAKQFEDNQLGQDVFITIYQPWRDKLYAAADKDNALKGRMRVITGVHCITKHPQPHKTITHFNKYPKKYDLNAHKSFITAKKRVIEQADHQRVGNQANTNDNNTSQCSPTQVMDAMDTDTDTDNDDENDSYWKQNIDAMIQLEQNIAHKNNKPIMDIPMYSDIPQTVLKYNPEYSIRGIIQRIYINPSIYSWINKDNIKNLTKQVLEKQIIRLLVQDDLSHFCMISMDLLSLLNNISFDQSVNEKLSDKLKYLARIEGSWYQFDHIQHNQHNQDNQENNNELGLKSYLYQFNYMYLRSIGSHSVGDNLDVATSKIKTTTTNTTDIECYSLSMKQGNLLKHGKFYYHYNHFASDVHQSDNIRTLETHKNYMQYLSLRHFRCKSVTKSIMQQSMNVDSVTTYYPISYQESLLINLMDIKTYLQKYWGITSTAARISVIVRIVAKSMNYHNVIYITDNSLIPMEKSKEKNIDAMPIIINDDIIDVIPDIMNMNNNDLYKNQPLVVMRDIAVYFENNGGRNQYQYLQLRFDQYSIIHKIKDIAIDIDQRKCSFVDKRGDDMITPHQLLTNETPWIALNTAICKIEGNVQLVSIKDGFDTKCAKCRDISNEIFYAQQQQNMIDDDDDESKEVEGIACIACFQSKGEIRLIINNAKSGYCIVMIPISNMYYQALSSKGIQPVIDWQNINESYIEQTYIEQLKQLKVKLNDLINNDNKNKLKQCVVEFLIAKNDSINNDSIDDIQCYNSFCCVI